MLQEQHREWVIGDSRRAGERGPAQAQPGQWPGRKSGGILPRTKNQEPRTARAAGSASSTTTSPRHSAPDPLSERSGR